MPKKIRTQTVTTEENEVQENNISKYIKKFFDTGELESDLIELQMEIRVQRWDTTAGKYITLFGTKYNNLEGVIEAIGRRYGSGKYKFYIKAKNPEGKVVAGAVIEDYDFQWDTDDDEPGLTDVLEPIEERKSDNGFEMVMTLMKAQIESQNNLLLALLQGRNNNGGGVKSSEILEAIQTGVELAGGKGNNTNDGAGEFDIMKLLGNPVISEMIKKVMQSKEKTPET